MLIYQRVKIILPNSLLQPWIMGYPESASLLEWQSSWFEAAHVDNKKQPCSPNSFCSP